MSWGLGEPNAILLPADQKIVEYAHGGGEIIGEGLFLFYKRKCLFERKYFGPTETGNHTLDAEQCQRVEKF